VTFAGTRAEPIPVSANLVLAGPLTGEADHAILRPMNALVERRREAGVFLRSRRERVRPEDVGLEATRRRRVPGLRREELARLAGVSVEYYVRLEQGRAGSPSDAVVVALSGALRLDDAELTHLRELCRPAALALPVSASNASARPSGSCSNRSRYPR
jgi:hypothetical protein